MRLALAILILVVVFAVAFTVTELLVPDIVAIADIDSQQPLWALETAFLLRAIENITVFGGVLLLVAAAARWLSRRTKRAGA
jgi:hypothetical protein